MGLEEDKIRRDKIIEFVFDLYFIVIIAAIVTVLVCNLPGLYPKKDKKQNTNFQLKNRGLTTPQTKQEELWNEQEFLRDN